MDYTQLITMKKSRTRPNTGDVFVIQPHPGVFYYGKVILSNVVSKDSFVNGMYLIYLYDYMTNEIDIPHSFDECELLISPMVVNKQPWIKGYVETVGNKTITSREENMDYGFFDVIKQVYVDINGDIIEKEPSNHSMFGLGSYASLAKEVYKAIKER